MEDTDGNVWNIIHHCSHLVVCFLFIHHQHRSDILSYMIEARTFLLFRFLAFYISYLNILLCIFTMDLEFLDTIAILDAQRDYMDMNEEDALNDEKCNEWGRCRNARTRTNLKSYVDWVLYRCWNLVHVDVKSIRCCVLHKKYKEMVVCVEHNNDTRVVMTETETWGCDTYIIMVCRWS